MLVSVWHFTVGGRLWLQQLKAFQNRVEVPTVLEWCLELSFVLDCFMVAVRTIRQASAFGSWALYTLLGTSCLDDSREFAT